MSITFEVGDWLRWSTPNQVKQGQVVFARGMSLIVRWLDGAEQTFPSYEVYVPPIASFDSRMEHIEEPKEAARIERDRSLGVMSISRAASHLGTTPKRIRAMLRAGQLRGSQVDGKWVSVDVDAE